MNEIEKQKKREEWKKVTDGMEPREVWEPIIKMCGDWWLSKLDQTLENQREEIRREISKIMYEGSYSGHRVGIAIEICGEIGGDFGAEFILPEEIFDLPCLSLKPSKE